VKLEQNEKTKTKSDHTRHEKGDIGQKANSISIKTKKSQKRNKTNLKKENQHRREFKKERNMTPRGGEKDQ